jgi:hypothetical protein
MKNRNRILYWVIGILGLCIIGVIVGCRVVSVKEGSRIKLIGSSKMYGTKFIEGFYGTHSKGRSSLMLKDGGSWRVVWSAIGGWPLFAWDDAVLFVAVTSPSGDPKYMLHLKGFGTANIDAEVRSYKLNELKGRKNEDMIEGRTRWQLAGNEIVWSAPSEASAAELLEIRIKLQTFEDMARRVRAKDVKRVFNGNEFFE